MCEITLTVNTVITILVSLTAPSHRITGFNDITADSDSDLDDDSGMYLPVYLFVFVNLLSILCMHDKGWSLITYVLKR